MGRQANPEIRENILSAAHDLIYKLGFKGVSMDQIAQAAQIKKANLFHYYPTKDALGLAVFEYATRGFHERLAQKLQADPNPLELIRGMFDNSKRGMENQGCCGGCFTGNLAQELSDSNEAIRQKVAEHFQSWNRQITTYLERQKAQNFFSDDFDPAAASQSILALLEGALLFCKATRQSSALENGGRMAVSFLTGFKKKNF